MLSGLQVMACTTGTTWISAVSLPSGSHYRAPTTSSSSVTKLVAQKNTLPVDSLLGSSSRASSSNGSTIWGSSEGRYALQQCRARGGAVSSQRRAAGRSARCQSVATPPPITKQVGDYRNWSWQSWFAAPIRCLDYGSAWRVRL